MAGNVTCFDPEFVDALNDCMAILDALAKQIERSEADRIRLVRAVTTIDNRTHGNVNPRERVLVVELQRLSGVLHERLKRHEDELESPRRVEVDGGNVRS